MYECFHCLTRSVIWDADFSFEDYGIEGEGLINHCHCTNCGAEIDYFVPITDEDVWELRERYGDHDMADMINREELAKNILEHLDDKAYRRETWDAINEILKIISNEPKGEQND